MRLTLLLILVVAFAVFYESDAGWFRVRIRGRRIWRRVKPRVIRWAIRAVVRRVGKRDSSMEELDKDMDQAELEKFLNTREAKEFMETAGADGETAISESELKEIFNNLKEDK